MAEIKYDIVEEIGILSENAKGWTKELNLISWNGEAKRAFASEIKKYEWLYIIC